MRSKISKNFRFILITGLVVLFLLVMVSPVSAELRTIKQGGSVFIGEQGLDLTSAIAAYQSPNVPTSIGWWPSAYMVSQGRPPDMTYTLTNPSNTLISPAIFGSYTGNWYPINSAGTVDTSKGAFIVVTDPSLHIDVWDYSRFPTTYNDGSNMGSVSGKSVFPGDQLGFKIYTNMDAAGNPQYRPNANAATDGFINGGTAIPLSNQFVNAPYFYWGSLANNWYTDALENGQYAYPPGTYTVYAESTLNNMRNNYQLGGADYIGKTVSRTQTVTIVSPSLKITSNKDIVVRSNSFSCTVTGVPNTIYDLYTNNGDVSGITPPTLYADQYSTPISSGHIQTRTNDAGVRTLEFVTSQQTTPMIYTIKVINPKNPPRGPASDQVSINVLTVAPTPTPTPTPSFGTIVIQSNPATANIYLDNLVKGVTPLTINNVPNGAHVVLLRLYGYQDSSSSINVQGDTQTINPTLTPIGIATTGTTTIPTTTSVTTTTTTGVITTQLTTTVTTATPTPTAKVNYSATIAAMQSQIAEQGTKIAEQGNILDQIMTFLRNVFGFK
ncbi:MAG: DUF3821 domain-containing protein [Deltaproteobacteria bacterium]|nr:DUF3821 domain-containing protein [Deltaproteobacteria bacterium]